MAALEDGAAISAGASAAGRVNISDGALMTPQRSTGTFKHQTSSYNDDIDDSNHEELSTSV